MCRLASLGLRALCLPAAAVAVAVPLSGCTGGAHDASASSVVRLTERDFRISAPKEVAAGDVVLRVKNRGPDAHELIVVRAGSGALPLRSDGLTISEEAVHGSEVGALEPGQPNSVRELHVHLTPGRYVLFCNMSGHYLGGMHADLVVH
jgi:uncharacterized cupredoxin-like copper-binding protein